MNRMQKLIRAAQEYDAANRPKGESWTRVPDPQVLRLLTGALLAERNACRPWRRARAVTR